MSTLQRVALKLPELSSDELASVEAHIDGIRMRKRELAMPLPMSSFKSSPSHWPEPHPPIPHTPSRVAAAEVHIPERDDRDNGDDEEFADALAPDQLYASFAEFTLSPAATPPPTAAVHSSTDSDPRNPSSRERAPVPPPPAPDRAAPPAPQDVHAPECTTNNISDRSAWHWCDCDASKGHDRECARWEGFDRCDCSLSDDPYKERRSARFPERKVEPSTFLCDHCNTVSGPHHSCDCGKNAEPDVCGLPAAGRRLAVRIKTGAIDEVTAGSFDRVEHDGRWRVKLEKRGVALMMPGDCMVCPESWGVK